MIDLFHRLLLASDAMLMAMAGLVFWLVAGFAALMEKRRVRKRPLDRLEAVGWVPWTPIFVGCAIIGGGMLSMSAPVVLGEIM
ncbi:MAG: hypothetical protein RIB52_05420 [Erythrobacter sp.]|uniref:hypothetical protein n=1 Tax=Erythrobacter sp. TaxID=1042 RepID=UPI0032ED3595